MRYNIQWHRPCKYKGSINNIVCTCYIKWRRNVNSIIRWSRIASTLITLVLHIVSLKTGMVLKCNPLINMSLFEQQTVPNFDHLILLTCTRPFNGILSQVNRLSGCFLFVIMKQISWINLIFAQLSPILYSLTTQQIV